MAATLFNMTPAMLHSIDHAGRIDAVSDLWLAKLGYALDDVIGHRSVEFLTEASARYASEVVLPAFWVTGSCDVEYEMLCKDGTALPVRLRGVAVRDADGMYVRSLAALEDLSESRALERKMLDTQKLESLGLMAGNIAHDFNNLLVSIVGNAQLVKNRVTEPTAVRCLADILTATERAADLCRQLLAYSGRGRFQVQDTEINALVTELKQVLAMTVGDVAIDLELATSPLSVLVDPTQIRQVVMNLVINAAESFAGDNGTITITTSSVTLDVAAIAATPHPEAAPGTYVRIDVSDTGSGMASGVLQQIFDPFFSTKGTGRGLGLAAVHGIVRGHRGTLLVDSEPGRGTRFSIYLPANVAAPPPIPRRATGPIVGSAHRGTVLVVDDDEMIRVTLERLLVDAGFDVILAASGAEALRYVATGGAVTAFLIDVTMPTMSGPEVARQVHAVAPAARIVMMSGYDQVEMAMTGEISFLLKPFTEEQLIRVIERAAAPEISRAPETLSITPQ